MQKYNLPKKKFAHPQKSSTIQSGSTTDTYNHHADSISQFTTFLRMIKKNDVEMQFCLNTNQG